MMKSEKALKFIQKYILEILLICLIAAMALVNSSFLTPGNLLNILRNMALQGVIAFGMTVVIIGGEIDLSVGSTVALTGVIIGLCCGKFQGADGSMTGGFIIGLALALLVAVVVGILNAFFVTKYKLPSMIVTLAMQFILYGIAATISKGFPITTLPAWYDIIGSGEFLHIPVMALIMVGVFIAIHILMSKMKIGRNIYAVGGNQEAARLSGINVVSTKIFIMIIIQICCVISGIMISSQVMSGSFTFGKGWEMTAIAAVVIGGTSFNGGIGKAKGTFIGLIFLGVILNAMTLMNVSEYVQYIVRGGLILFAVVINSFNTKSAA